MTLRQIRRCVERLAAQVHQAHGVDTIPILLAARKRVARGEPALRRRLVDCQRALQPMANRQIDGVPACVAWSERALSPSTRTRRSPTARSLAVADLLNVA